MPQPTMKPFGERFGAAVSIARTNAGLTRAQLTKRTNFSPGYIAKLENGEVANPGLTTVVQLAYALDTTPDALLGLTRPSGVGVPFAAFAFGAATLGTVWALTEWQAVSEIAARIMGG